MATLAYEKKRILIWGKTYPELSNKYRETVCTGGVFEESGLPVRIYPIPFRYLDEGRRFQKYQWITADVRRKLSDPRPESYEINCDTIQCGEVISTTSDEWGARARVMFSNPSWQFESVDGLLVANKCNKTSLGIVSPREILGVGVTKRPDEDARHFQEKIDRLQQQSAQMNLFEDLSPPELKHLDYMGTRLSIKWLCHSSNCNSHNMQVLDWEVAELYRNRQEQKALQMLQQVCDLRNYATRFFLGNLQKHPTAFTIVGLWYPKRVPDLLFR